MQLFTLDVELSSASQNTQHCNQILVKVPSLCCAAGVYEVWPWVKLQNCLVFSSCGYIVYYPKKKELLGCTDEVCLLTFFLMTYVLWEQNTALAQKTKKDGGSKWARTGVRRCWSPQQAGQGKPWKAGSLQHECRSGATERKKCLQWGADQSQASEVMKRRRHSSGSRGAEQPKKPLTIAGMWKTPPRRQMAGDLFVSLY